MIVENQRRIVIAYDDITFEDTENNRLLVPTLYDGYSVSSQQVAPSYVVNYYDNTLYPLNGAHIKSYAASKMQKHATNRVINSVTPLTQPDFHCPLAAIFRKCGYVVEEKSVVDACTINEKFIYAFTLKYFYFQHQGIHIHTKSKIPHIEIIKKQNYFKELLIPEVVDAVNSGRCMLILNDVVEATLYDDDTLNTLVSFLHQVGINNIDNVIIATGNPYNAQLKTTPKNIYWQYFENSMQLLVNRKKVNINYDTRLSYFCTPHEKTFRFLMLNNKTRAHRLYICYKLWRDNPNFFEQFCVSCKMRQGRDIAVQLSDNYTYVKRYGAQNSFNVTDILLYKEHDRFQEFLKLLPLRCFFDSYFPTNYDFNQWDNINNAMYERTGIQIVTETLVEFVNDSVKKMLFLTEKTFKPISTKSPFIILGQPGLLKLLRQQGYMTYSEFWCEDYDDETDPVRRADMIVNIVNSLSLLSDKEFVYLLKQMQPIANHNFKVFAQRSPQQQLFQCVDNFYGS
jgi:hypothetical protein